MSCTSERKAKEGAVTGVTTVRTLTILVFVAVAAVALVQARRQRDAASWWISASFALIAAVTIALGLLPDDSENGSVDRLRRLTLAALPAFPYCLFRFTAVVHRPRRWLRHTAAALTVLASVSALVGWGAVLQTGASSLYQVLLLVQWSFLSVVVASRLWRAGRTEPRVARRRMRTMSAGILGLTVPLLLVGAAPDDAATALVIRGTALVSAVLFLLALAPPRTLRVRWRRPEEARLRQAVAELMAATTPERVMSTLLPHVAAVLGARGAALVAEDGRVLAAYPPTADGRDVDLLSQTRTDVVRLSAGQLSVFASPYTPVFGREELGLLESLGGLADLALQRCKDHGVAETLQRSLLPESLPCLADLQFGAHYLPSESGAVGGDWYDVIRLPDDKVGLAIGDVMGHGLGAATLMGHLRSALRAYALDGSPPVDVLTRLDGYLEHLDLSEMATVLYAVLDPPAGTVRLGSAGHPAPLLRTPVGEVTALNGGLGPPLGLFTTALPVEASWPVPAGSTVLMFTDGLIERRGESVDEGLERLRDVLGSAWMPAGELAPHVVAQLVDGGAPDDVAVLVAQLAPAASSAMQRRRSPAVEGRRDAARGPDPVDV
jgi:hypothetical protein